MKIMNTLTVVAGLFLALLGLGMSDRTTFDCPMRQLALKYAMKVEFTTKVV
jgi:hypothetical protein